MNLPADYYDDMVTLYIRLITKDSPDAAATVEQIRVTYGARAALHATLAMTLVKIEVQRQQPNPDVSTYDYLLVGYRAALPLLEQAIQCWVKDRSLRDVALGLRREGDNTLTDAGTETAVSVPELPTDLGDLTSDMSNI